MVDWRKQNVDPQVDAVKTEYRTFKAQHVDPQLKVVQKEAKKAFDKMVEVYGVQCKEAYQWLKQHTKENKDSMLTEPFQKYGPAMKESCQEADRSVNLLLRLMLFLLMLPFAGSIFGLAWGLVRLAWNIFLTVTLLRFILPKRTKKVRVKKEPKPYGVQKRGRLQ